MLETNGGSVPVTLPLLQLLSTRALTPLCAQPRPYFTLEQQRYSRAKPCARGTVDDYIDPDG
jgi:hypothetical protein